MFKKFVPNFSNELRDPRYFQILFLGSFLFVGINYLGWNSESIKYLVTFLVAIITQLTFSFKTTQRYSSIKSALITALGLCLLLKTGNIWVTALASFVAIASKFLIKSNGKHIFNPANIGIILAILITGNAWVSPGQWGSSTLLWFLIGACGFTMILKVNRLDTTIVFLLVFGGLLYCRQVIYLGWETEVWLHKVNNGTLLLFSFFMITDPMTIPNHKRARIIWASLLALLLFVSSNYFYIQTAAIWLLFLISPFTPMFDKYFSAPKYKWNVDHRTQKLPNKI